MTLPEMIELMKTGGPYTVIAVLAWVARYLYQAREKDKVQHDVEKQKLNDRLIGMSEKQNEVLEQATANQAILLEAVQSTQHTPHKGR